MPMLQEFSAYDLPSVKTLIRYLHDAAGFPVRFTWLAAIKAGNYSSWLVLTYFNAFKITPDSNETLKGHLKQNLPGPSLHQMKGSDLARSLRCPTKPAYSSCLVPCHVQRTAHQC